MIKELSKDYLAELVKLNISAFKPIEDSLGKMDSTSIKEYFEYTFREGKVFGYFIDGRLVGCIGYVLNQYGDSVEIEHVLLEPEFHKKGIGREMMVFIEYFIKEKHKKVKEFRLSVRCKNEHALEFYERNGYSKHAYIMKKKI